MSTMTPDPDEQFARQILEDYFTGPDSDWTREELDDALRAVELDEEERGR